MCEKSTRPPTCSQLEHAIKRNFGGLESQTLNPFEEFESVFSMSEELPAESSPEVGIMCGNAFVNITYL